MNTTDKRTLADELRAAHQRYWLLEEAGESVAICPTEEMLSTLLRAADALTRQRKALDDLLNMVDSEAADFDNHLAYEECFEAAKHQARLALELQ